MDGSRKIGTLGTENISCISHFR